MRGFVLVFVLTPMVPACSGNRVVPTAAEDTDATGTTAADTPLAESSTSAAVDETGASTGEPAEDPQSLFYLTEFPHELRTIAIDGTDDRLLVAHADYITESRFIAAGNGVVLAHGELPGSSIDETLYANVDGSVTGLYQGFVPERVWFGPEPERIWYPEGWYVTSRLLGESGETFPTGGGTLWMMSRTRRFVASTHFDGGTWIGDLTGEIAAMHLPPAWLPGCGGETRPTLWFNRDQTRVLLFPTPSHNLARLPLDDPEAGVWLPLGPEFRPLGYDVCADGLLGRTEDGAIIRIGDDASVAELAPPGPSFPAEFPFEYGVTPSARRVVALTTDGSRQLHLANLSAQTWTTVELPRGSGTLTIVTVDDDYVLLSEHTRDGQVLAHRLDIDTGAVDSAATCDVLVPAMTEDGALLLCEEATEGLTLLVEKPGEAASVLLDEVADARLMPAPAQVDARCVDTEPVDTLVGCW